MKLTDKLYILIIMILILGASYAGVFSTPIFNKSMWWIPLIVGIPMSLFIGLYIYFIIKISKK